MAAATTEASKSESSLAGLAYATIALAPGALVCAYIGATFAAFLFGPIEWPVSDTGPVTRLVVACLLVIGIAFLAAHRVPARAGRLSWRLVFTIGGLSSCLLLLPSTYVYTGKFPWQILSVFFDQYEAYLALQTRLASADPWRVVVALIRTLLYPAIVAVVPLGLLNWSAMSLRLKLLWAASIVSSVTLSFFRGTDREIFDLGLVFIATGSILLARGALGGFDWARHRRWVLSCGIGFLAFAVLATGLFIERKAQRFEAGNFDLGTACVGFQRSICPDADHPMMQWFGDYGRFTVVMVESYVGQGYYGLSMALDKEFTSTFGTAHSPLVTRLYTKLSGDSETYKRSYTYRLGTENQWFDTTQWSTLMVWLANDVGFPGALACVALLSFAFGVSWRDAISGNNNVAAVVFCLIFQVFAWFPANNQMMQAADAYLAVVAWTALWIWGRTRDGLSGVAR